MRNIMIRRLAFGATLLLAAGCGGGSSIPTSNTTVTAPGAPQSTGTAPATLTIVIPNAPTTSALQRQPQYVSPATQSLSFAPATGSPIVVPLGTGTPGCVTGNSGTTCSVNVALPIGASQVFVVSTYASANGTGTPLSTTKTTQSIVTGQPNPINLTLGGVPASVVLGAPASPVPAVAATSIPVTVTVKDASGNTIVGNTPFSNASGTAVTISLSDADASGATKISPATLTAPGSATVAYDNYYQPTSALITASATGVTNATATITFAAKPLAYTFTGTDTLQLMAFTRSNAPAAKGRRSAQTIVTSPLTLAALLPTGNASHPYALGTNLTPQASGYAYMGFSSFGMATAPSGHLYFTERGTQYGVFDAGTTPTLPAPSTVIGGSGTQTIGPIALGPGGIVWAGVRVGSSEGIAQINPVTGTIVGSLIPLPSQFTQTHIPQAIAVGPDGSVYIDAFDSTNGNDCEVAVFTGTGTSLSYAREFWTGNMHFSSDAIYGIAVDIHNTVYVSVDNYGTLDVVPGSSSGNVLPSMVYSNYNNYDDGLNLVVDAAGNIIWTIDEGILVIAPNTGAVPPGGTNPANPFVPGTDSTVLQTVSGTGGNAEFGNITEGPGF
jgi:hypothetical protein